MANGGWYGTAEEWERLESPLQILDPALTAFASDHGFEFAKNGRDWPERSLRKVDSNLVRSLIQIFVEDQDQLTFNFWVAVSQDRGEVRYWKQEMLCKGVPLPLIHQELSALLEQARRKLDDWCARPESLEFATKLSPLPK